MARPLKFGLDYFPMNVDFFDDDKIQFVASRFHEKGELIAVKLLCKIFKSGYYITWNEDVALLFAKGAGNNITHSLANDVVNELVKRDFFHKGLFERFAILTSNGIQRRYENVCIGGKRKHWEIEEKYDVRLFTPELTELTTVETEQTNVESTQRKVKESKVKESKGDARFEKRIVLENPFSEKFLDHWIIWKDYKKKEFRFFFKSVESEQATINELVHLSQGNEQTAIEIINQSMAKGWKGLFQLKENGQSNSRNGSGDSKTKGTRSSVQQVFNSRYSE